MRRRSCTHPGSSVIGCGNADGTALGAARPQRGTANATQHRALARRVQALIASQVCRGTANSVQVRPHSCDCQLNTAAARRPLCNHSQASMQPPCIAGELLWPDMPLCVFYMRKARWVRRGGANSSGQIDGSGAVAVSTPHGAVVGRRRGNRGIRCILQAAGRPKGPHFIHFRGG